MATEPVNSIRNRAEESLGRLLESLRRRVAAAAASPFMHAPYPLAHTLDYPDDPGLLGPDSVSWMIIGDIAAIVGGIRGMIVQAAHPEVVAGVGDYSRYREDPLGRLSRTSAYVAATTYGAMPEVSHAVEQVNRIHRVVAGVSSRDIPYSASDPALSAWVHNVLTESFLVAHQAYGGRRLSPADSDRFVLEQTAVGRLLDSAPMPTTASALSTWVEGHPDVDWSPEMQDAVDFLIDPPLDPTLRLGYKILMEAAVATIPPRLRRVLNLTRLRAAVPVGRAAVSGLRWAMGYSPTWQLALMRTNSEIPEGLFKQPVRAA